MAQSRFLSRSWSGKPVVKVYEPTPRSSHNAASIGRRVYSFGGITSDIDINTTLSKHVDVFDPVIETWLQGETGGDAPLGFLKGAFAASHSHLYHYGGWNKQSYFGDLSRFCPATMLWTNVSRHSAGGPMKKSGCRMICCGDILGQFGGFGTPTGPALPGSMYIEDDQIMGRGWTDEFCIFDINKEVCTWSCPATTGTRPSPRDNFSFTEIDDHRAVLFAGRLPGSLVANDTYLMDLQLMEWNKLDLVDGGPVPVERWGHAACCVNVGDDHPLLLVTGGRDKAKHVLNDAWLLDIVARRWNELQMPKGFQPRWIHSLTATSLAPGITVVTAFGGCTENYSDRIAETTLLQLEQQVDQWCLTDVTLSNQLGHHDRVGDKIRKMEAAQAQVTSLRTSHKREQVLKQRVQGAERREQEAAERRLHASEQQCHEAASREHAAMQQMEGLQISLHQAEDLASGTEAELAEAQEKVIELEAATKNARQTIDDAHTRIEELNQHLQESEARIMEQQVACQTAENRVQEVEGELEDLCRTLEEHRERARQLETQWVIERRDIELTEEEIGRGGWAVVNVANFRGLRVAAKCLYKEIRDYYRDFFIREMNMAARLRHPNLVQFIGATLQGEMIILTELMRTSLRAVLEERFISHNEITSISLDVARALNYLHLMQPEPLIHRDISSANVLLEPLPNNSWKAKVSDYGSVNLQRQLKTVGPGSPVYAAPEAKSPDQQSPKMDIFSFGVLLIEMCTARFPEVDARQNLIRSIQHPHFVELIGQCMSQEFARRPSTSEIISQLIQLRQS